MIGSAQVKIRCFSKDLIISRKTSVGSMAALLAGLLCTSGHHRSVRLRVYLKRRDASFCDSTPLPPCPPNADTERNYT